MGGSLEASGIRIVILRFHIINEKMIIIIPILQEQVHLINMEIAIE